MTKKNTWREMGEEWIRLAQTSEHRIYLIMPYMLDKLQHVVGKNILDLAYSARLSMEEELPICHFVRD